MLMASCGLQLSCALEQRPSRQLLDGAHNRNRAKTTPERRHAHGSPHGAASPDASGSLHAALCANAPNLRKRRARRPPPNHYYHAFLIG